MAKTVVDAIDILECNFGFTSRAASQLVNCVASCDKDDFCVTELIQCDCLSMQRDKGHDEVEKTPEIHVMQVCSSLVQ